MKAEAWLVIEFPKPRNSWQKRKPKITKVLQKKPESGMCVKVELDFPDEDWAPTIQLTIDPLQVKGAVGKEEMRDRAARYAEAFLNEERE